MSQVITFLVTNRLFAAIFAVVILLVGWARLPELNISQYPNIDIPMLTINVYLPGASSVAVEQQVVKRIEEEIETVRQVREVNSRITNSFAQIAVEFNRGVDIDIEYTDVYARLNNLRPDMPRDAEVVVLKQNPTDRLVSFILGVSGPGTNHLERLRAAEVLKSAIREIDGLENLKVMQPEEEIRITVDPGRMARYGVELSALKSVIQQGNQFLPTGTMTLGDKSISVLADSAGFTSLDEVSRTQVLTSSGTPVAISDIAIVERRFTDSAILTTVGSDAALWVSMKLSDDSNVFVVRQQLEALIENMQLEGITVSWLFDVEEGVDDKLWELVWNMAGGILILGCVLLFAVGYRSAFIITTMLPVAMLLSVIGLSLTDYGIQEISLAAFIIALGLIVDSGIVVTENAFKLKTYEGASREQAAIEGTAVVLTPLASATITTALAFAPVFLLDSVTGLFLHSFVVVIWLCLAASLIAAVCYAAVLVARIGTDNEVHGLPRVASFMNALIPFRDNTYVRTLRYLIERPTWFGVVVLLTFAGSLMLASQLRVIVFPDSEEPYFTVTILADRDRSTGYMQQTADEILEIVMREPEVTGCATIVGATFPAVHTGIRWLPNARNVGTVFCNVKFRDSHRLNALTARINEKLHPLETSADLDAAAFVNGEGVDAYDIELELSGSSIDVLQQNAIEIESRLQAAGIIGISRIHNPAREAWFALNIEYREEAANALGVSRESVDQALVLLTTGLEVDDFRATDGLDIPIRLRADTELADPLDVFDRVFVRSASGDAVPLSQLVRLDYREAEFDIYHHQFQTQLKIGIQISPDGSLTEVSEDIRETLADVNLSAGVHLDYGGKLAVSDDAFGETGRYVGIIALVILGIFVLQFRSLTQPLIVFAAIPLSFIGGFILLWLTNQPLSFLAFVGLTSLMGIVINNSILIVDEGNRLARTSAQTSSAEIAISAARNRFMPVLLTTITTISGLLPLAIGDSMFKPLAIVVIGGLISSTVLTLLVVPLLFARLSSDK